MSASRLLGRFRRDRSGAGAVEFAIAAPILFTMMYFAFEFGWAMQSGSSVRSAVENASRMLISNPDTTNEQLQAKVNKKIEDLPIKNLQVTVAQEWLTGNIQVSRVTWTYKYTMAMPFVPSQLLDFSSSIIVPRAQG